MYKNFLILIVLSMVLGCQSKQKPGKEIPTNAYVKIYVSALKEDSLLKVFQKPELFSDPALDVLCKKFEFSSADFKYTHALIGKDPARTLEVDSLLKQAIEAETMKSLNDKEPEKN